jgi:hypothetical protein
MQEGISKRCRVIAWPGQSHLASTLVRSRLLELQLLHLLTAFVWPATRTEDQQALFVINLLMNWMCRVDEIASKNEEKKRGESGWKFHGRHWVEKIRCNMFAIQSRKWPKRDEKRAVLAKEESNLWGQDKATQNKKWMLRTRQQTQIGKVFFDRFVDNRQSLSSIDIWQDSDGHDFFNMSTRCMSSCSKRLFSSGNSKAFLWRSIFSS